VETDSIEQARKISHLTTYLTLPHFTTRDGLASNNVQVIHQHPDHIGGTLDDEGKPVYPDARYFVAFPQDQPGSPTLLHHSSPNPKKHALTIYTV
jgi:hypothetical protein